MMKLLQTTRNDETTNDRQLNADLRAKIYEQTRLIAELRHDEVNRQQTSKVRLDVVSRSSPGEVVIDLPGCADSRRPIS